MDEVQCSAGMAAPRVTAAARHLSSSSRSLGGSRLAPVVLNRGQLVQQERQGERVVGAAGGGGARRRRDDEKDMDPAAEQQRLGEQRSLPVRCRRRRASQDSVRSSSPPGMSSSSPEYPATPSSTPTRA
ncbi:uncharacterized protein [Aegilops tauschii subsp. strangulata]|uniref:uncharacterized protein isoform X2 n=1 Tax=Aegilops tauschii subsp. strangulata TaxID=200361 RepID=UPI00098BA1C6|nr:uncharacterized protein LOC109745298 isoform X2 [Aegilops tauschii subsp. strangulata]